MIEADLAIGREVNEVGRAVRRRLMQLELRAVEFRALEAMLALAVNPATSSQARAITHSHINDVYKEITTAPPLTDTAEAIHRAALIDRINEFQRDPAKFTPAKPIEAPPGMPIGTDEEM